MPEIGQTISHYRIIETLGQGGMGEVFLAHDTSLDRKVALKFLPDIFSGDPERLARFEREAKLLASLNHPNIATIYGLEQAHGKRFLAMELVEGETLAQQIARGPLPVDEALEISRQIAEGLEAAHEKGVIHRDLKPANVKITPEGKVKILDFGLAKALQDETPAVDASKSPTLTDQMTRPGVILGTAAYMAPEQAKGRAVDKRADIWAFGCILYECLTGKRAFEGETISETLASILKGEPDWKAIPSASSAEIRKLLQRCLEKNSRQRLHDIADARILLESAGSDEVEVSATVGATTVRWRRLPWAIAVVMALTAAVAIWQNLRPLKKAALPVKRFVIPLPESMGGWSNYLKSRLAISPDGMQIAWVGGYPVRHLYHRRLDDLDFREIPSINNPTGPFFSPDGAWIGIFVDEKLKKVPVAGGPAEALTDAVETDAGGGDWFADNTILFQNGYDQGLWQVDIGPSGNTLTNPLKPDQNRNERGLLWPQSLPAWDLLLFTVFTGDITSMNQAHVAIARRSDGSGWTYLPGGMFGRYLSSGHLVYGYDGKLMAISMNPAEKRVWGEAKTVLDNVMMDPSTGCVHIAISNTGDLVYVPGGMSKNLDSLVIVERSTGNKTIIELAGIGDQNRRLVDLNVSPDGKQVAIRLASANDDLYVYDLSNKIPTRFTYERGDEQSPVWLPPNGQRLAYSSLFTKNARMFVSNPNRSAQPEAIFAGDNSRYPSSFKPDGSVLAFVENHPKTKWDIWTGSVNGGEPRLFLGSAYIEAYPTFSPDGNWIAYQSDKSGQMEIYVISYPDKKFEGQISQNGGTEPRWGPGGKELYYLSGDQLMAAEIVFSPDPRPIARKPLFLIDRDFFISAALFVRSYDVIPGGQKFVFIKRPELNPVTHLVYVQNWFEELKRLVPVK